MGPRPRPRAGEQTARAWAQARASTRATSLAAGLHVRGGSTTRPRSRAWTWTTVLMPSASIGPLHIGRTATPRTVHRPTPTLPGFPHQPNRADPTGFMRSQLVHKSNSRAYKQLQVELVCPSPSPPDAGCFGGTAAQPVTWVSLDPLVWYRELAMGAGVSASGARRSGSLRP
jgi:hypothetical protein